MKANKFLIVIFVLFIAVMSGSYLIFRNRSKSQTTLQNYKISDISSHNNENSCWTVINNNVYDVTKFVPKHKGGNKILSSCGIDATDLFTGKSPLGRVHSEMAVKLLSSMKIGTLSK